MEEKILTDDRFLESLLKLEESYTLTSSYFVKFNKNSNNKIKPSMRKTLATWMLEVCEEQSLTDEIFSLSMNLFDRVMNTMNKVEKYHLQLIGSVCLFIASKLKSSSGSKLSAIKLVEYTDNSITLEELVEWELIVLEKLKWNISSILPNDFIEIFLHRSNHFNLNEESLSLLKRHCYAFTALCSTDFKFSFYPPSMIASACLLTSLDGLNLNQNQLNQLDICNLLFKFTNIDIECLLSLKECVDDLLKKQQSDSLDINDELEDSIGHDYDLLLDYNKNDTDRLRTDRSNSNSADEDFLNIDYIETNFYDCQDYTYEQLIESLNNINAHELSTESPTKKLKNQLNNSSNKTESTAKISSSNYKKRGRRRQSSKKNNISRSSSANSNSFNSSSSSSGISSTMSGCLTQTITPPLAFLLPMPSFNKMIQI
jgi:cyclin D2